MKTKFDSYMINDMPEGCKRCLKGEKLVLFMTGKCPRKCSYCSLSDKRKKSLEIFANERPCNSVKDVIKEAKENNATGAGITGGDPLVEFEKTYKFAKALKKKFGKNFHIHIYLPTNLVTPEKMKKLSKYIDEVRFHPLFLQMKTNGEKTYEYDVKKIKMATKYFGQKNTGLEMPVIPEKVDETLQFIEKIKDEISFVNLNELELSQTNFDEFTKKYSFAEDTYSVATSKAAAQKILKKLKDSKLKVHFCTAQTKEVHQYNNRLLKHNILPYGHRNSDGTVIYFAVYAKEHKLSDVKSALKHHKKIFVDKSKKRIILSQEILDDVLAEDVFKVARVMEYPTLDKTVLEFWEE